MADGDYLYYDDGEDEEQEEEGNGYDRVGDDAAFHDFSSMFSSPAAAAADSGAAHQSQQQQQAPGMQHNPQLFRPGYVVTDNVSYYNLVALMTLLHAHSTEGISIPVVFDKNDQSL